MDMRSPACHHCGEPLPAAPVLTEFKGAQRAFCCGGCAGAARFIEQAGLGDYYKLREEQGRRVGEDAQDYSAFDREDVLAEHSRVPAEAPDCRELTLIVDGMRCAACSWLIDRALGSLDGVEDVQSNAISGRVRLRWRPARLRLSSALERLAGLGYAAHLSPGEGLERARAAERRQLLLRLGVAGLGSLQAMMFAEALYLDFANQMAPATRDFFRWITFAVSAPVVFYAGWPFLAGMVKELRQRRLGMDTLIGSSVLLAYFASLVETLRGGAHVWFDAAVMFVFFLLVARYLERMARQRANAAVDALAQARPALAWRLDASDEAVQVPVAALAVGDRVRVPVGEALPADGVLDMPAAEVDEALLSGESTPVTKRAGDEVYAGSVARLQPLRLRITRTGQDTRLSHLTQLVERAQNARPRVAQIADRVAGHFVAALMVSAALTFAVWWQFNPERAFEVMLAVLVVSCPCALSLAIPAALATAGNTLTKLGALPLRGDALSDLADVDTVLLDKTGTLTTGSPQIARVEALAELDAEAVTRIAAALERDAGHPLARAFAGIAAPRAEAIEVSAGAGVAGEVEGRRWRIGHAGFAAGLDHDLPGIWLGDGARAIARFELVDAPRSDAHEAIAALRTQGLRVEVLSGDAPEAVEATARTLGIERWSARATPESKLARLRELQAQGHRVLMLGDGINDAPVLGGADVSFALACGAPMAHRAADIVLSGERLMRLPQVVQLARRTRRMIRENLAWALVYNAIALPFAAAGWVTPWIAALGMAGSSLLVTLNALRLGRSAAWTLPDTARMSPPTLPESPR
ncbi:heavy metal translocating P-type ATPase [Aquimonas voraii]|uniref:Cu2+-exporting ATPase n=1 Tax=Aquimonas voraii TaxID=265719 RepID=A0A1G6SJY2_9GAMM|nr:heavy metal translocating P-type ATPase [Aquimonas voraii]SDD17179.1 Cu2+-exporting ATPase [Aquimonas voraii]